MTASEVSDRWNGAISPRTLANWRCCSKGPPFVKFGGVVLYDIAALEDWERSRLMGGTWEARKFAE